MPERGEMVLGWRTLESLEGPKSAHEHWVHLGDNG